MLLYALRLEQSSDKGACFFMCMEIEIFRSAISILPSRIIKKRLSHYDLATSFKYYCSSLEFLRRRNRSKAPSPANKLPNAVVRAASVSPVSDNAFASL